MSFLRKNHREIVLALLLFAAFLIVNPLMQWLDPSAGALDWSFLTLRVAGLFNAGLILLFTWIVTGVFFPTIGRFIDSGRFAEAFTAAPPESQLRTASLVILALLIFLTVCVLGG